MRSIFSLKMLLLTVTENGKKNIFVCVTAQIIRNFSLVPGATISTPADQYVKMDHGYGGAAVESFGDHSDSDDDEAS